MYKMERYFCNLFGVHIIYWPCTISASYSINNYCNTELGRESCIQPCSPDDIDLHCSRHADIKWMKVIGLKVYLTLCVAGSGSMGRT